MASEVHLVDDIFDEDNDVNLGDKDWDRLKQSLIKVCLFDSQA